MVKSQKVTFWEDDKVDLFGGIALLRPVFAIRCGLGLLREQIHSGDEHEISRWVRPHLVSWMRHLHPGTRVNEAGPESSLFLNARLREAKTLDQIDSQNEWVATVREGDETTVVAARLLPSTQKTVLNRMTSFGLPNEEWLSLGVAILNDVAGFSLVKHPFDLLFQQEQIIGKNVESQRANGVLPIADKTMPGVWLVQPDQIFLHPSVKVGVQTVLDASEGPIWIDEGTVIEGHAFIKGPVVVGAKCTLRAGIKLYGPSSIGPVCKLGGEIQQTLWMGYSNKQHDGYLGTAVVGSWVNIGAGTNNSDLKNTYGPITITISGKRLETGEIHIGCLLGDHTKTSIGLQLNTGTVTGIACNLFGAGFPPTYVPSFSWGGVDWLREHGLSKAMETAKMAMSRRNREFTPEIEEMFQVIFKNTAEERNKYLRPLGK